MDTISYEFKHPTGGKSAYVSHDVYGNGDEEFLSIVPGERTLRHSSMDKATKRIQQHGYTTSEKPEVELGDVPVKSYRHIQESTKELLEAFDTTDTTTSITTFSKSLCESYGASVEDSIAKQALAIFEMVYAPNAPVTNESTAIAFLNSTHAEKLVEHSGSFVKNAEFVVAFNEFSKAAPAYINESKEDTISEATAPGMEDWVLANKKRFIDQYGKEKGTKILYATAWKMHDEKLKESAELNEMVMDAIKHPTLGRVEWRNEGGYHTISTTNKDTGAQNIHALGDHKKIADKWAQVKQRLLKESNEWVSAMSMATLEESVASLYAGE